MAELLSKTIQEVHQHLESYRFNDGANALYRFLWGEFCDWGIEFSKADKDSILELGAIFKESMLLLHPYMPFISEYLWHKLDGSTLEESGSIMVKPYPTFTYCDNSNLQIFELISDSIISIRRAKTTIELANQKIPKAYIKSNIAISKDFAPTFVKYVSKLAKVEEIEITSQKIPHCIVDITAKVESYIPIQEINLTPIISRLEKQQEKTQKEIIKLQSMLKNEKFIANAPAQVLETNKKALIEQEEKLIKIQAELKSLKG